MMNYNPYYQYPHSNRPVAVPQVDNTINNNNNNNNNNQNNANSQVYSRLGPWSLSGVAVNEDQARAQARPAELPSSSSSSSSAAPSLTFGVDAPSQPPAPTTTASTNVAAAGDQTSTSTTASASSSTTSTVTGPSQVSGILSNQVHAADSSTSSGLGKGTLFAAIFIPIVAVAFICSLCLICFMRRRRRMRREMAARGSTDGFGQPPVEQLSSNPFSARQSRAVPSLPPISPFTRHSTLSEPETSGPRPLITVEGPSYSRSPDETPSSPPAYRSGSPRSTSPTNENPPRPLSEANVETHRTQTRSPFDHPDDDAVSDVSDGADPYAVRGDSDNLSIVSSTTGYPARRPTNAKRI
ncbi:MAG: hypothetical protein M1823_001073 [Watsoniomyces obsoletus]|nr:MAG: hypothetical protein M1823_001073 [Watsoniomyces obsoletus]